MGSTSEIANDVKISDKAAEQIKRIKNENDIPENFALRIGVKGGGCSGLTYHLGFDGENKESDAIIEEKGVKLFIDGKSLFYLMGTELDYSDGLNGKGFQFKNPNAKKSCGCGESFSV